MKKCSLLFLLVAAVSVVKAQNFTVEGRLKNFKPIKVVVLTYKNGETTVNDSAFAKNDIVIFNGIAPVAGPASLQVVYVSLTDSLPSAESVRFFLEKGKTLISATGSLDKATVSGGKGQEHYALIQEKRKPFEEKLKILYADYTNIRKAGGTEGLDAVEEAINTVDGQLRETVLLSFIRANPESPYVPYALNEYAGWDIDPAKVQPLLDILKGRMTEHPVILSLKERVELAKKTALGQPAIEFSQADTLGKAVSLSSFRGKYVLIDFWASWCGPCRKENPNLVNAFHRFKDKNFTVLGVSLDRSNGKEKWMKAIHDDKLAWTQVSDLKFWDNEVAKLYGIRAIPQNVLVDPNGIIVGKNLTGKKLEAKLNELLK